ncbi:MAG TPA: LysE family translocator [Thermoanaerobaculia bacterium]|nr:LysE family translocator [Thermoanaerobaculia bacterium]
MPTLHTIVLFMAAALALNLTPGPDMLYVVTRSSAEGRRSGISSALGISFGCLFHISAVALGLSSLLRTVPAAYDVVRFAGASYLIYLGIKALVRPGELHAESLRGDRSQWAVFRQGVLTNVLNPKVALFFLALLPQFVDPRRGSAAVQIVTLGLLFTTSGTLVNAGVALGASGAAQWLQARKRAAAGIQRAAGAVFIALGLRIAFARR